MSVPIIFTSIVLLWFLALIASGVLFDRLVMVEYFNHRYQWELDGKPTGFFWVPEGATVFHGRIVRLTSSFAGRHAWRVWLWSTPAWMKRDRKTLRLLHWWRGLFIGSQIVVVVTVAVLVLW